MNQPEGDAARIFDRPTLGYDVHHIVEQQAALADKFPKDLVEGRGNLAGIPEMKRREISNWYQTPNKD